MSCVKYLTKICKSAAFVDARTLRQEIRERRRRGALLLNSETGGSHPPIRISGQVTAAFRPSETSGTVLDPDAKRPKVTLQDIRWRRRICDLEVSFGRSCLVWWPVPRRSTVENVGANRRYVTRGFHGVDLHWRALRTAGPADPFTSSQRNVLCHSSNSTCGIPV